MYIKLSFLSKHNLNNKEKKKYIDKLFPDEPIPYSKKERNQGFIHKFNNAIGFKVIMTIGIAMLDLKLVLLKNTLLQKELFLMVLELILMENIF